MNTWQRNSHSCTAAARRASGMQGFSIIYVVIVITVVAALAASVMSITTGASYTQLRENDIMQARYMALSGLTYMASRNTDHRDLEGETVTVDDDAGNDAGQFTYLFVQRGVDLKVRAGILGTVNAGTAREANYYMEATAQEDFSGIASSIQDDFEDFTVITSDPSKTPVEKIDGTEDIGRNARASRGSASKTDGNPSDGTEVLPGEVEGVANAFAVGAEEFQAFGIATFSGNRTFNEATCIEGECDFNDGVRFFMTVIYERNDADGLVITVFNGANNDFTSVGGDSVHGEMIAYAGDGRVHTNGATSNITNFIDPERNGIQPPKLGLEIDNYGNRGRQICGASGIEDYYWFHKSAPPSGRRYDPGTADGSSVDAWDHFAFVAWGYDVPYICAQYKTDGNLRTNSAGPATTEGAQTYDDNQHNKASWLYNPRQYHYSMDNRNDFVQLRTSANQLVGQSFYVEEDLTIAEARVALARTSASYRGRVIRAYIYNATLSGSDYIPTGSPIVSSRGDNDTNQESDEVFDRQLPPSDGGTSDTPYPTGTYVMAPFYFKNRYVDAGTTLPGGNHYVLVVEYRGNNGEQDVRVGTDNSSPEHPGTLSSWDGSNWNVIAGEDMIFTVFFDPPETERVDPTNVTESFLPGIFYGLENTDYNDETDYRLAWGSGGSIQSQTLAVRLEVHRSDVFDTERGGYPYRMIFWIRKCGTSTFEDGCPGYINTYFSDTSGDLVTDKNPPAMERTMYLNATAHNDFDTFLVGISEATGGATQEATFSNIIIQFRDANDKDIDEVACFNCTDRVEF